MVEVGSRRSGADEVGARPELERTFDEQAPEAAAQAVAHHRRADRPADGERHPGRLVRGTGQPGDRERTVPGPATVTAQLPEGRRVTDPPEGGAHGQAERRWRPLRRRALRMVRPARVDMRWRKPWFLARFRVLGWNVRFTKRPL